MEFGLHRMEAALAALSLTTLPHLAVQVVGTNGKGSTGAFLAALLAAHGLPTGLYLSPHFQSVRERILMGNASKAVDQATQLAGESGQMLEEIVAIVEASADQVRSIATASEQQSAASEEINRAVDRINQISSETAEAMGTAGHIDHGKTALVKALSGIDCDRLAEEKKRGITIELGFAFLDLPDGSRLGIIDVPGHAQTAARAQAHRPVFAPFFRDPKNRTKSR